MKNIPSLSEISGKSAIAIHSEGTINGQEDIAVIGMDMRLGTADNAKEYWEAVKEGKDCIIDFPADRKKDADDYFTILSPQKQPKYKQLAYLSSVDEFDYSYFKLSKREADLMDPNQRLFLQCAFHAIEDAGYLGTIEGSNTGVYFANKSSLSNVYYDFVDVMEHENLDMAAVGNKAPVTAARISYILDLHGPNMILDTACSGSLVALHLACQALREGDCDSALVGSVRLDLLPLVSEFNIGIEASDGRTRTFDNGSNGTGGGEGVAAVFLKPLSKAIADKDHIYAVIKGTGINQDGRTIGITAPNSVAQAEVIKKAWKKAGVSIAKAGYIEAHGTGTKLGDPIEIEGLKKAYAGYTDRKRFCGIGSVKANIGHLDNCAGMAGIIKVILMMNNRVIPPLAHFQVPNAEIDFWNSPFYIPQKALEWSCNSVRYAGVSAWGLSGTNAHAVLGEYICEDKPVAVNGKMPFILSAKTEESLREYAKAFAEYLDDKPAGLYEVCYTLAFRRKRYEKQVVFMVESKKELSSILNDYLKGEIEGSSGIDNIEQYFDTKVNNQSLPIYPFAKERCWVKKPEAAQVKEEIAALSIEDSVSRIYEKVLGCGNIDRDIGFFELGGDSLIALKIVNTLASEMNVSVSISDILVNGSINAVVKICKDKSGTGDNLFCYLKKAQERPVYPLSSPQKRMFVMDWYRNIGSVYNMNRSFMVEGPLDIEKAKSVFMSIVERHESLRTTFDFVDDEPVQIIHDDAVLEVEVSDVTEGEVSEKVMAFFGKFDLKEAPLFRVGILHLNEMKNVIIIDMHHIISDGTSTGVIMNEFVTFYEGRELPKLPFHYRDYTMWQIECDKSGRINPQRDYWHKVFEDSIPVLQMPYDFERPAERDFKGTRVEAVLEADMTAQLKKLAGTCNTSLHILLLAAYYILLEKYSNQEDLVVGVATSGRNSKLIENNVGMFVNTLPIRAFPKGGMSLEEFIKELTEISYEAYRNQDYQLDDLIESMNFKRDGSRNPLFDAVFTIIKYEEVKMKELKFSVLKYEMIKARFDIIMTMCDYVDYIDFSITYATSLFLKETVQGMLDDYVTILEAFISDRSVRIEDLELRDFSDARESDEFSLEGMNFNF